MFKLKNFQQVKTTAMAILGGILVIAGILWPETVTEPGSEAIRGAVDQILVGTGSLVSTLTLMFGAKDG